MAADGHRPRNTLDQVYYAQNKLKRYIKGGISAISLHEVEDLKSTDFPFMIAYEAPDAPTLDWPRLKGNMPTHFDVEALTKRITSK